MKALAKLLAGTLVILACCFHGPLFAVAPATAIQAFLMIAENRELTTREAVRLVQRKTGGKVLRVRDAGGHYQVKVLLPNGVVKSYSVNKATGSVN